MEHVVTIDALMLVFRDDITTVDQGLYFVGVLSHYSKWYDSMWVTAVCMVSMESMN